jgi:hypothetical protein
MGDIPVFLAGKDEIFPVPLDDKPIEGESFTQV